MLVLQGNGTCPQIPINLKKTYQNGGNMSSVEQSSSGIWTLTLDSTSVGACSQDLGRCLSKTLLSPALDDSSCCIRLFHTKHQGNVTPDVLSSWVGYCSAATFHCSQSEIVR